MWKIDKPFMRRKQSEQAVMIVDDSISEKPYTDETSSVGITIIRINAPPKASTFSRHFITAKVSLRPSALHWWQRPRTTATPHVPRTSGEEPNSVSLCAQRHLVFICRQYDVHQVYPGKGFQHADQKRPGYIAQIELRENRPSIKCYSGCSN